MNTFKIPSSIDAAREECAGLEDLAFATGWHRSAIVWAFCDKDAGNGGDRRSDQWRENQPPMSLRDFAEQGLPGLSDRGTVRKYYNAWQHAIDAGIAEPVHPGDTVTVPSDPWPPVEPDRPVNPQKRGGHQDRPTPSESARLHDMCGDAYRRGYRMPTIARAIGRNSLSTVSKYVAGVTVDKKTRGPEPTEPLVINWRDSEQPVGPLYQRSPTLAIIRATLDEFRAGDARNRLANDAAEAENQGDTAWVSGAVKQIEALTAYLTSMSETLTNADARRSAQDGRLRVVGG